MLYTKYYIWISDDFITENDTKILKSCNLSSKENTIPQNYKVLKTIIVRHSIYINCSVVKC